MTCSSETSQGRPCCSASRRDGAHHRRRAADIQLDLFPVAQRRERVIERPGDEAVRSAAAVFGRQDDPDAEALEEVDVYRARPRAGRRRRASSACRARAALPQRQKRREPDAARQPSRPAPAGSTGSNGCPSGPRQAMRAPGSTSYSSLVPTPMRLLRSEMPTGAPFAIAKDFEDRERPPQQRVDARATA